MIRLVKPSLGANEVRLHRQPDERILSELAVNVLRLFIRRIWNTAKRWAHCARFRLQTTRRKTSNVVEIPLANLDCENRA